MFGKTTFLLAAVAAIANVVVATPPACMLGAVNTYKTPSDISAVCKSKDMTGTIAKMCGDGASDALSAFADICNKAGVKVATDLPSGTVSASAKPTGAHNSTSIIVYTTASFDSACSCTKTAAVTSQVIAVATSGLVAATGTGVSPAGATKTPTGTGAPQSTGAAGKNGVGLSAAALLAGLGVMAAAL